MCHGWHRCNVDDTDDVGKQEASNTKHNHLRVHLPQKKMVEKVSKFPSCANPTKR